MSIDCAAGWHLQAIIDNAERALDEIVENRANGEIECNEDACAQPLLQMVMSIEEKSQMSEDRAPRQPYIIRVLPLKVGGSLAGPDSAFCLIAGVRACLINSVIR
jgi:hypothetical protein